MTARLILSKTTLERSESKVARLIAELTLRPKTQAEIAEFLCLEQGHTARYLRIMRFNQQVHISRWTRAKVAGLASRPRAVWSAGAGVDARKPKPITRKQANKRQAASRKRDPDRYEKYLRDSRQRMSRRNFKPRMDIAAAWIVARPAA